MFEKILMSSHNPEKVSLSVNGVLMNIVGIIVLIGGAIVDGNALADLVQKISVFAGTFILLVGQGQIIYGLARKLWSKRK